MPDIRTIYVGCDTNSVGTALKDLGLGVSSSPFYVPRAAAIYVAVAYLVGGDVKSVAGFSAWSCSIKEQGAPDTAPVIGPAAPTGAVTALIDQADYESQAAQNVLFFFSGADMNQTPKNYTLWITALDTGTGERVLIGQADFALTEAGLQIANSSTTPAYSQVESDARYPIKRAAPIQFVVADGQMTATAVVPGLAATDLLVAEAGAPIRSYIRNVDNVDPSSSSITITTATAGPLTINAIVFLNQ